MRCAEWMRGPRAAGLVALLASGCMFKWPGGGETGDQAVDSGADVVANPTVGFVYVGPVGDHGWTLTHELGRQHLENELDGVDTHYEPSVSPADALDVMEQFIADGDNIVITTSHDFLTATQTAAANHPDVRFLSCSGFTSGPNLGSYFGRMYQPWYLAGMVAASKTCTDRIGFVAPVTLAEIVRHINAFTIGAREVNPDIQVEVIWTGSWFDPEQEPVVTQTLIDRGADVIVGHTDTSIPVEVSAGQTVSCEGTDSPVWSVGYDNPDTCDFAPETCLTAPYWNWGPLYARLVSAIADGSWDPHAQVWDQMTGAPEESTVALAPLNENVDGTVRLEVEGRLPELTAEGGKHLPFVGPLVDTQGTTRFVSGEVLADDDLLRMCWFVEGVIQVDGGEDVPGEVPPGCEGDY